ncbi:PepSY domain-containing protein [Virgibacillus ainsalahensis]
MKKKLGILIGTFTGAALLGFGVYQTNAEEANPALATDEVQQMVTDQYDGTITEMELDKEFNRTVYEVEIEGNGVSYEVKVDADTGEVLKENAKEYDGDDADDREEKAVSNTDKNVITTEEAGKIALNEFSGTIVELELDEDDDRLVYEIEIENGDNEAEFDIDAHTGEIFEMDMETDDDND